MKTLFIALVAWFALGALDLLTGFVDYSNLRVLLLFTFAFILLPLPLPAIFDHIGSLARPRTMEGIVLFILTLLGYALFLSRYQRGANMADDAVFREVIENSARGCLLCYAEFGGTGTYFIAHNNLFLLAFVPLILLPFGWLVIHFVQSIVIVSWCRLCGWAIGGSSFSGWLTTVALFLATFSQHAAFYDTRFTALALAALAVGFYLNRHRLLWISGWIGLLTRETFGLTLAAFGLVGFARRSAKRTFLVLSLLGLFWWIASYVLMFFAGGPIPPRFDSCMLFSFERPLNLSCLAASLATDAALKLAYTLRLLRFAPSLGALPSLAAALPDLGLTWLSKDNVLYNLGWHYYMQTLGMLIVGAGLSIRTSPQGEARPTLMIRWIIGSCLWQFVTTFNLNLF